MSKSPAFYATIQRCTSRRTGVSSTTRGASTAPASCTTATGLPASRGATLGDVFLQATTAHNPNSSTRNVTSHRTPVARALASDVAFGSIADDTRREFARIAWHPRCTTAPHMRPLAFLTLATLTAACVDAADSTDPTEQNLLEADSKADGADPLWAGLTSITMERYAPDPCNDGRTAFGDAPYIYGDWERQRAGIRNICFEVWKPGVTDWDNPDFWRQLDVQVHYRYGTSGAFTSAYVNSNGRRGNNRRYAWTVDFYLDPTITVANVTQMKAPFRILSESNGWAHVEADLELYFTVNGRALKTPSGKHYVIRYQGYVRTQPPTTTTPDGLVLHDIVICEQGAARFGSGAGYFVADITHAAGVATLAQGLDGSLIYGARIAQSGPMLSLLYGSQVPVAGETLPGFHDHGGLRILPDGDSMRVEVDVYDRALGATRQLSATFGGCSSATN